MITIAVQVHNFQHRFSWFLSSLAHQIDAPPISVDVSCVKGNGTPTTEQICALYADRLDIRITEYPLETLQYRGLTRNGAILRCSTDWLLFADCDMVYHPDFFNRLESELANANKLGAMFIAGRFSNDISKANAMVQLENYDAEIPNPWKRADARLNKIKKSCVGAGYFQLINVDHCEHDNYYVDPAANRDFSWLSKYAKANSDRQFRRRIGKCVRLPKYFHRAQIHLNHNRDNGNGIRRPEHLTEQR